MTTICEHLAVATLVAPPGPGAGSPAGPRTAGDDIPVTAERRVCSIENAPASRASVDAVTIEQTINARNVKNTLKYLPSLIVRKRHIGDGQAPVATRNNTTASLRWNPVSTGEIARVDILYGPFLVAYPGNSIGAVVDITAHLPDRFEATMGAGTTIQAFDLHDIPAMLPAYRLGGTIGDRFGSLAILASADHVDSSGQPLGFATAVGPATTSTARTRRRAA